MKCVAIPFVRNSKTGKEEQSKLFLALMKLFPKDRKKQVDTYNAVTAGVIEWESLNDQGEPDIVDVLNSGAVEGMFKEEDAEALLKDKYKEETGIGIEETLPGSYAGRKEMYNKADMFNRNMGVEGFVAVTETYPDSKGREKVGITIKKKTPETEVLADKMRHNALLNARIRDILRSKGVSVGVLNDLETRMKINGVTDFDVADKTVEGLIEMIRIAKGVRGEEALPEEFAHLGIEMLGDNALVDQLMSLLNDQSVLMEVLGDQYGEYAELYSNDPEQLKKEAIGKMVAKHMLNNESIPASKPYSSLIERIINAIKSLFKSWGDTDLQEALLQVDEKTALLARALLNPDTNMSLDNIKRTKKMFQVTKTDINKKLETKSDLLSSLVYNEYKNLKLSGRSFDNLNGSQRMEYVSRLETLIGSNAEEAAILDYMSNAITRLNWAYELADTINNSGDPLNERAKKLRVAESVMLGYSEFLKNIEQYFGMAKRGEVEFGDLESLQASLAQVKFLAGQVGIRIKEQMLPTAVSFLQPYAQGVLEYLSKEMGGPVTLEQVLTQADCDISVLNTWLQSAAECDDYAIKILDNVAKRFKENARLAAIKMEKEVAAADYDLRQAGLNPAFMHERDSDGKQTGYYISPVNRGKYYKERKAFIESLNKKYGTDKLTPDQYTAKSEELKEWVEEHTYLDENTGLRVPSDQYYKNEQFYKLMENKHYKAYYDIVIRVKMECESYLPKGPDPYSTIKIFKDFKERAMSDGVTNLYKNIKKSIKDTFTERSDDDSVTTLGFDGQPVRDIPVRFRSISKDESEEDVSTDVTSSLIAFAAMACNHNEMDKCLNILEITKSILAERKVKMTRGSSSIIERVQTPFSNSQDSIESDAYVLGGENRMKRIEKFFDMQVYERYLNDEGFLNKKFKISTAKTANAFNSYSAVRQMALNIYAGISNVATGRVMGLIEGVAKEYFDVKDLYKADWIYKSEVLGYIGELGENIKTSKLALFEELFNVMQDYENSSRYKEFDKSKLSKAVSMNSAFFMTGAGEHWLQLRTALAYANSLKLYDKDGKEKGTLWDMLEVVPIDKSNPSRGAELKLKSGEFFTKDGKSFDLVNNTVADITLKVKGINQRLHGIYNKADMSAIQSLALGRMAMQFRKWLIPSINRRFAAKEYNMDLQHSTEGYYRTAWRFINKLWHDYRQGNLVLSLSSLSEEELANIKRAATEVGVFCLLSLSTAVLEALKEDDGDDDKDGWFVNMLIYQMYRLKSEIGVLTPSMAMPEEAFRIFKSPFAGARAGGALFDLFNVFNPWNYELFAGDDAIIQSGNYKDWSVAEKSAFVILPAHNIIKAMSPEKSISFYTTNAFGF